VPALPGTPRQAVGTLRGTAPATGEHTAAILAEHGYSAAEIKKLMADGVVAAAA
jgi:crotonobetainyl-CoA:carnitine CoA-transferase CaiB-like acyl-CoA transferase